MSLKKMALALLVGSAMVLPMVTLAGPIKLRVGAVRPSSSAVKTLTDWGAWGVGVEYTLGGVPSVLNGENWSTSISADLYYSERKAGIARYIPVSINQVYTFEEQNGHTPYAGFGLVCATSSSTYSNSRTRFGAGLILGLNITEKLSVEARYDWIDKSGDVADLAGIRGSIGYRF